VLYAGDNPIPDVLGPHRAGMVSVWVNRNGLRKPRNVPQPDLRVKSLAELTEVLMPARGTQMPQIARR
jgi:FMN phosphatase YigB (HAD superfamily)